jgi:hypothetical protein
LTEFDGDFNVALGFCISISFLVTMMKEKIKYGAVIYATEFPTLQNVDSSSTHFSCQESTFVLNPEIISLFYFE